MLQGVLGGVLGALIGIGGAALVTALAPTLEATVAAPQRGRRPARARAAAPSSASAAPATRSRPAPRRSRSSAPVDVGLIALAIGLALLGGLIAGSAGGLRASRLRPADALRHID